LFVALYAIISALFVREHHCVFAKLFIW